MSGPPWPLNLPFAQVRVFQQHRGLWLYELELGETDAHGHRDIFRGGPFAEPLEACIAAGQRLEREGVDRSLTASWLS